jgi:predicted RNase H-like HicB family nuclease
MLTAYVNAAMKRAHYELMEDNEGWFATISEFAGLWAHGKTVEGTRDELKSTLEDWILVAVRLGRQLPIVEGIDLNVKNVA